MTRIKYYGMSLNRYMHHIRELQARLFPFVPQEIQLSPMILLLYRHILYAELWETTLAKEIMRVSKIKTIIEEHCQR